MGKIIGIDLGTTNSVVAVMEGEKPTVIVNEEGNRTTPSVVGFGKDGERLVGSVAKRQAITNPEKTVSSIKRFMGQKFDECESETSMSTYKVVRADNGQPRVQIDDKQFSPPEISAMILQKLKREAVDRKDPTGILQRWCRALDSVLMASRDRSADKVGRRGRKEEERCPNAGPSPGISEPGRNSEKPVVRWPHWWLALTRVP